MALMDVVRYEGGDGVLAWKYPNNELRLGTQVIVNETQEVVFFKGGKALDKLGPGRHTLKTENIPILCKLVNIPFGGKSPFSAELWYVNKAHSLNIKWGTPTPIQIQDSKYGILVPVRAFGQFGITVKDSKLFLTKIVGTAHSFDYEILKDYFRGVYITKVKDTISQYIVKNKISILQINAYLDELSEFIKEKTQASFDVYGISLINFYVNDISIPEDDSATIKLKEALAKKAEMDIVGFDYDKERTFDTLQKAAEGGGSGSSMKNDMMGAGLGMSMGMGLGETFNKLFRETFGESFGSREKNDKLNGSDERPNPMATMRTSTNVGNNAAQEVDMRFEKVMYKPLSSAKTILQSLGYVDKNSLTADNHTIDEKYTFKYITDDGKNVLNPANWIVSGIELDDEKRVLYIGLTRKEKDK